MTRKTISAFGADSTGILGRGCFDEISQEWVTQAAKDPSTLLYVASEKRVPALVVSKVKGATMTDAFTAAATGTGTDIKLVAESR